MLYTFDLQILILDFYLNISHQGEETLTVSQGQGKLVYNEYIQFLRHYEGNVILRPNQRGLCIWLILGVNSLLRDYGFQVIRVRVPHTIIWYDGWWGKILF